jgi:hypothetical protein
MKLEYENLSLLYKLAARDKRLSLRETYQCFQQHLVVPAGQRLIDLKMHVNKFTVSLRCQQHCSFFLITYADGKRIAINNVAMDSTYSPCHALAYHLAN